MKTTALFLFATLLTASAQSVDWGDAPDSAISARYPTLTIHNGARHTATGPLLGTLRDAETNGQPTTSATGDDATSSASDDEDGVEIPNLVRGDTVRLHVTVTGGSGFLNAWIDWNHDDDWDDAGERVFTNLSLAAGASAPPVSVPAGALEGKTFARFRLTPASVTNPLPTGSLPGGEVEDYAVSVVTATDLRLTLAASSTVLALGQDTPLTVTLTNSGPVAATALTVGFALPAGLSLQGSASASSGTWNGTVWNAGSLASGSSATLTLTARAQTSGTPVAYAEILTSSPADTDATAGNHSGRGQSGDPAHEDDDAALTFALGSAAPPQDVSGKVWYDADEDGIADAGEPGLAAVTVKLRSAGPNQILDDSDDTFSTAFSGTDGSWLISARPAGLYRVTLDAAPSGFVLSGSAPAPFTVGAAAVTGRNIGLRGSLTFSVTVLMLGENTETNAPGVPVSLTWAGPDGNPATAADNRVFGPVLTKPDGPAVFQHLPPGAAAVALNATALPAGVRAVDDPDGTGTPHAAQISTTDGAAFFSYTELTEVIGHVFSDHDNDGLGTPDDGGAAVAQRIELIRAADGSVVVAEDNVKGFYHFTGFPPDSYRIRVSGLAAGHFFSPLAADTNEQSGNDIAANGLSAAFVIGTAGIAKVDAGVATTAIVVRVRFDDDGDGIAPEKAAVGYGLRGSQVQLFHAAGGAASAPQPAQSELRFNGIAAGSYFVRFTLPAGLAFAPPGAGDEASDSDAVPGPNPLIAETAVVTIAAGQELAGLTDALLTGQGIAGVIWNDRNANGQVDDFPPLPTSSADFLRVSGVTVRVINAATLDDAAPSQITGEDGLFGFFGLPAGTYFIKVTGLPASQKFSPLIFSQDVNAAGLTEAITLETAQLVGNVSAGVVDTTAIRLAITGIDPPAGGILTLHLLVEPGARVAIQQSDDLTVWTEAVGRITRPESSADPVRLFETTPPAGSPRLFYRLILQ